MLQYLALPASDPAGQLVDTTAANVLPGGSPEVAYTLFEEEHMRVWVPRFADELATKARLPFYRAVAQLIRASLL